MQVCSVIEKMFPQANQDNYEVTVFTDGHWEITKWLLDVPKPTESELQAEWDNNFGLDTIKQAKTDELDQACKNAILSNFTATLNGIDYEFANDMAAQSRFNGVAILFLGNKITTIDWTAYQNGVRVRITLTKDEFDIVTMAALKHQDDNVKKYNDLILNHVNVAQSPSDLSAITW